jgi:hypothetical protein
MKRNKLNFEEISQSMEVLDRDSQRGVKGGLSAAELLADIAANGIAKYAGLTFSFIDGQDGISYRSNNISNEYINGFSSGYSAYGGQGGYGNPYQLAEVVVTASKPLNSSFNNINSGLGAFGIGWGTKELIIQAAVANARGINIVDVNNFSNIRILGSTGAGFMDVVKQVSRGANYLGAGLTIADGFANGFQTHHAADLGIQATIYGISASVPVAGWVVGGVYFLGDAYFQSTHNGRSITEYYLD